jgi:hypothetical protein
VTGLETERQSYPEGDITFAQHLNETYNHEPTTNNQQP